MPPYYPIHDFGPVMKGMVIGGLGIVHVFVAQFAIGGGFLMCYFQWLAQTGRFPQGRLLLDSYFKVIVLISFVIGALTGVGMWFTTIQISARTIGRMVTEFHWIWATEWTFFCLEVVAGYAYYRCAARLSDRDRMTLLVLYTVAAWFSLFWINGILSWQLTPGPADGSLWSAFFNPTFWPSLLYRTVVSLTIAGLAACVVINLLHHAERGVRRMLIRRTATLLSPMIAMPLLGLWFLAEVPDDSRSWVLGGSVAMTMFMTISVGASLLIGLYAIVGILRERLYVNGATATLLCALALGATAGGEFVREGIRKPYTLRNGLYANSIAEDEVDALRAAGCVTQDPYPVRDAWRFPNEQVALGAKVFRFQCSVCHTMNGANGLVHLTGPWTPELRRINIANLQHLKPFMPPFAGNAEELEALVRMLEWQQVGRPEPWPVTDDKAQLDKIRSWLAKAGTAPGEAVFEASGP